MPGSAEWVSRGGAGGDSGRTSRIKVAIPTWTRKKKSGSWAIGKATSAAAVEARRAASPLQGRVTLVNMAAVIMSTEEAVRSAQARDLHTRSH